MSSSMSKITILKGDIIQLEVDALVNAANASLLGGGGVDGAIHRAAGPPLKEACRGLGGCETGQAKIPPGFALKAKHVIHTVGPVWRGGGHHEAVLLASCYKKSLELALENDVTRIAFPAISCGVYGFPIQKACEISLREVTAFLEKQDVIQDVQFVCFDEAVYECYRQIIPTPE